MMSREPEPGEQCARARGSSDRKETRQVTNRSHSPEQAADSGVSVGLGTFTADSVDVLCLPRITMGRNNNYQSIAYELDFGNSQVVQNKIHARCCRFRWLRQILRGGNRERAKLRSNSQNPSKPRRYDCTHWLRKGSTREDKDGSQTSLHPAHLQRVRQGLPLPENDGTQKCQALSSSRCLRRRSRKSLEVSGGATPSLQPSRRSPSA
jgi:hypothetical protein